MKRENVYPFTAIVGQEEMKLALTLNVINPSLGGMLIKGEKGTAKSTAVRALAELLPEMDVVKGCSFHCNPADKKNLCQDCAAKLETFGSLDKNLCKMRVVELPVSATEDRVVGTLDIEHAIKFGEKKFEIGILAEANRNILYVDEINLLDDHVVDVLLDAAAMGINTVEREGISYSHPAKFVLVGTMNPEEGDIRPQLLDRFGLSVIVSGEHEVEQRAKVIKRRLDYEDDPQEFLAGYEAEQKFISEKIIKAQQLLPNVQVGEELFILAAKIAIALEVDGHRADITLIKAAKTLAAFEGRVKTEQKDIRQAATLVLPHRMRRRPFEESTLDMQKIDELIVEM